MKTHQTTPMIRLSKKIDDMEIDIWINSEDEFREGHALLNRLCSIVELEKLRQSTEIFWIRDTEGKKVNESVKEGAYRVVLSLLEDWPNPKKAGDIQLETGLSSGSATNILKGRQGGIGPLFTKDGTLWKFSTRGESEVRKLIRTILESQTSNKKPVQPGVQIP